MSEEMEDLVKQYKDDLPFKIREIENQWITLQESWTIDNFSTFHLEVHNLSSSANLYGYTEISELSNQLQMYLLLLSSEPEGKINEEQKEKIISLLNQLKEAVIIDVPA